MKIEPIEPAREFHVGVDNAITLRHCADIELAADELVTFRTNGGAEYDVTAKDWGFYATPSINARLRDHGLRAVLVRNERRRTFVLLVEISRMDEFLKYARDERQDIILWLDDDAAIHRIATTVVCPFCGGGMRRVAKYNAPPEGENRFPLQAGETYHRELWHCTECRHVVNIHPLNLSRLYDAAYVDTAYAEGLRAHFARIIALPPERSDNEGRVTRVIQYMESRSNSAPRVLDVGSGLCVFLYRLRQRTGWECTALDTDPRQVAHAREVAGVEALQGSFADADNLGRYELITFNKVLEHVPDPVAMLARAHDCLADDGVVYVELPDGEAAIKESTEREEFLIEHYHAFSAASTAMLASMAGLKVDVWERVREPSGKYALRAFLVR